LMQLAKRRMALLTAAKAAKTMGVLVSSKPGQRAFTDAICLAEKLGDRGITAFIIYLDEVRADLLNNFNEAEAFIETACPRVAIDGIAGVDAPSSQPMRLAFYSVNGAGRRFGDATTSARKFHQSVY